MKTLKIINIALFLFISFIVAGGPADVLANTAAFKLEDESYVNDIPFNTGKLFSIIAMDKLTDRFRDEANINDIPFNTRKIAAPLMLGNLMENYRNERSAKDIGFDTRSIAGETWFMENVKLFRDEAGVADIPYEKNENLCCKMPYPPFIFEIRLNHRIPEVNSDLDMMIEQKVKDYERNFEDLLKRMEKRRIDLERRRISLEESIIHTGSLEAL